MPHEMKDTEWQLNRGNTESWDYQSTSLVLLMDLRDQLYAMNKHLAEITTYLKTIAETPPRRRVCRRKSKHIRRNPSIG